MKISMAEQLQIPLTQEKEEIYQVLLPQIKALIQSEDNLIANLANIAAALKEAFQFFWVGFYLIDEDELVLGPFQGPIACTRIGIGKGVCGTAFETRQTILVPDVDQFPGHIACSTASKSEIVVPVVKHDIVLMVLDIDSDKLNAFDAIDQHYLEELAKIIVQGL